MFIVILILLIILFFFILKRSKKLSLDSVVMINGCVGKGKSLLSVFKGISSINKAHAIWWRRKYIYSHLPFCKKMKYEEEPLLYSNIPIKHRLYVPLDMDIILRNKRCSYHSVILIDESSLLASSMDYKDKDLSNELTEFIKLVRHSLLGAYRNIFGSYPNLIINTQSKNDNHFAFDRSINQVLYLTKSLSIPFFNVLWCRDLLLIDSVNNVFDDDIKESITCRWFLVPKRIFKKYNSFAFEFLTHDKEVVLQKEEYKNINVRDVKKFYIPTFHNWKDIQISNASLKDILIEFNVKEVSSDGEKVL